MIVPETEIIISKDGAEVLRKTVRPGDYIIGPEPGCDVQLEVELVSRRHAQLAFIDYQGKGYRPAAVVWAELDAQQAAGKK